MADVIKRIDLQATLARMEVGESVAIKYADATETSVKTAVSRFNKRYNTELKTSSRAGAGSTTVTRIS